MTQLSNPSHFVFLCNKPSGASSNKVLQIHRRYFKKAKAGHTGSLDPLATGVLPLCFGEATKFAQLGLDAAKAYRVIAQFGIETNTGDSDGEIERIRDKPVGLHESDLVEIIESFLGIQEQRPHQFSALKYQGKPLYEYARQGIRVPIPTREICVSDIVIESIDMDRGQVQLWLRVSKGTYIRSIVQDIGEKCGWGAHVISLHRTHAGQFDDACCRTIDFTLNLFDQGRVADITLPVSALLLNVPWVIAVAEQEKLAVGHSLATGSCESGEFLKTLFLRLCANLGVHYQNSWRDDAMENFDRLKCQELLDEQNQVALYSLKQSSLHEVEKLCQSDYFVSPWQLAEFFALRGLFNHTTAAIKPRRMVASGCDVF